VKSGKRFRIAAAAGRIGLLGAGYAALVTGRCRPVSASSRLLALLTMQNRS